MKKLSVCVIDDSAFDLLLTEKVLKSIPEIGEIKTFDNPKTAFEFVVHENNHGENYPDIILLDIQMPEMDGFEWIDEIDQLFDDDFHPKVFLLSNSNFVKDIEEFEKQRISKIFLSKPLNKATFSMHVKELFPARG